MRLQKLKISSFRNLSSVNLDGLTDLNIFYGVNGSGKSSLLEAIYHLGFGRSFRTNAHHQLISQDAEQFSLFAIGQSLTNSASPTDICVGISRAKSDQVKLKINGKPIKRLSEIAKLFPIQIYTPQSSDVLTGSPTGRRKLLDWGLFHVEHDFAQDSTNFAVILKNRNSLLRKYRDTPAALREQIGFWDEQFIYFAKKIDQSRSAYTSDLKSFLEPILTRMLPEFEFDIEYSQGWDNQIQIEQLLQSRLNRDISLGYTSSGPQRADLKVMCSGANASERLSRGQLRLLSAAIMLAQNQHLVSKSDRIPIVLLDDLSAELDVNSRRLLVEKLIDSNSQLFMTAIELEQLAFLNNYNEKKVFHVEHGQISEET